MAIICKVNYVHQRQETKYRSMVRVVEEKSKSLLGGVDSKTESLLFGDSVLCRGNRVEKSNLLIQPLNVN